MSAVEAGRRALHLPRFALRLLGFALLWWVLTEGRGGGWPLATTVMVGAALISRAMLPHGALRLDILALLRFIPYFTGQALLGGWDVLRRTLSPGTAVHPTVLELPLRLRGEGPRVLLLGLMNLLPGTVSVQLRGDSVRVHLIDRSLPAAANLAELEQWVMRITRSSAGHR